MLVFQTSQASRQKTPIKAKIAVQPPIARVRVVQDRQSRSLKNVKAMKVMISGAPASGKGTQCARIVEEYKLVHISVGDILRSEVIHGTNEGRIAKDFMDRGALVPDDVVVEMVKHRLSQSDVKEHGWLLDGYPRTLAQAEAIDHEHIRPDVFLLVDVPDDVLVERVVGRRLDPSNGAIYHLKFKPPPKEIVDRLIQRSDDTEEKVRVRLDAYKKNVEAVVGDYTAVLKKVNGQGPIEEVFNRVKAILDEIPESKASS